jgi:prevent-host-death family protein
VDAENNFDELLDQVEKGETVYITRDGQDIVIMFPSIAAVAAG